MDQSERPILKSTHHEPVWKQYTAAFLASLVSMSTGCVASWSSPATPKLMAGIASDLGGIRRLTEDEASWIASLIHLGALFGSIPAGHLSFKWGRKVYLLCLTAPLIVGWLLIMFNFNNVWFLYLGRFCCGLSYGSLNVALPIYNNEICSDKIRGRIGIFYDLMQCVGILLVYICGAVTSLFWCTFSCMLVPIIFFITFIWMPESPVYLVKQGRTDDAIRSIKWLHGNDCDIDHQLTRVQLALMEGKRSKLESASSVESGLQKTSFFEPVHKFSSSISKVTIKAIAIAFGMFFLQRTCGASIVVYYAVDIFQTGSSSISADLASIATGAVQLFGSMLSVLFIDNIGRRPLLLSSFFIMAASIFVFTAYLQLIKSGYTYLQDDYGWIPAVSLCIFVGLFRIGVSPIPWLMAPELIPTEAQRWAQSSIVCISWGTSFILSKTFLSAMDFFGHIGVYGFFTFICTIGIFYTALIVPETRNKSRVQIQRELGDTDPENHDNHHIKSSKYGAIVGKP